MALFVDFSEHSTITWFPNDSRSTTLSLLFTLFFSAGHYLARFEKTIRFEWNTYQNWVALQWCFAFRAQVCFYSESNQFQHTFNTRDWMDTKVSLKRMCFHIQWKFTRSCLLNKSQFQQNIYTQNEHTHTHELPNKITNWLIWRF